MRYFQYCMIVAFATFSSQAQSVGVGDETPEHMEGCGKSKVLMQRFESGMEPKELPAAPAGLAIPTDTDVLNQALDIEIFPGVAAPSPTLSGSNTMTVRCVATELTHFEFMLAPTLTISEALLDDTILLNVENFGVNGRRITFPTPIHSGDVFTLKVTYSGRPTTGSGSTWSSIVISNSGSYSLSEPFYSADWWPTKDGDIGQRGDNSDKSLVQVSITAPSQFLSLSNGLRQSVTTLPGNKRITRWATAYPTAPYLVFFASYPYTESSLNYTYPVPGGGTGTMPVYFAGHSTNSDIVNMLRRFRPLFGEYPFINEKYGVYRFGFSGGMEHQTYTGQNVITSKSLNSHELAHQWWGDNVTCRFWNDLWLNEGFATYGEWLYEEFSTGTSNRAAYIAAVRARKPSSALTFSVYVPAPLTSARLFNSASTYGKGGWILHMLRGIMGDTVFFDTLKAYRAMYEGSAATTDDFQSVCESMSGFDLDSFFDHYVYGIDTPTFALAKRVTPINGSSFVEYTIRQTQPAGSGLFSLPLEMAISGLPNRKVWVADTVHRFVARTSTAAPTVTLDPNEWVLRGTTVSEAFSGSFPGVVVDATPSPGSRVPHRFDETSVTLYLSEDPDLSEATFRLDRQETGVGYPVEPLYDAASHALRLRVSGALPPGHYVLTATDIVGSQTRLALDGDVSNAADPTLLPSGDGTPGGPYRYAFSIDPIPGCPIDLNGDSTLTFEDFDTFVQAFESGSITGDFNLDGQLTFEDFDDFVEAFTQGCGTVEPI